jgi:hypothetical protein
VGGPGFCFAYFAVVAHWEIMRNPLLALGCFILGAVSVSLIGIHAPVFLPTASGQTMLLDRTGAAPVVSTSPLIVTNEINASGAGYILKLDGIDCINCEISNGAIVQYSGGPFKLEHFRHSGVLTLDLRGGGSQYENLAFLIRIHRVPCHSPETASNRPQNCPAENS